MSAAVVIRTWFLCCHIIFGGGAVVTSNACAPRVPIQDARTFTEYGNVGKQVEDSLSRFLSRGHYALSGPVSVNITAEKTSHTLQTCQEARKGNPGVFPALVFTLGFCFDRDLGSADVIV
ncbi:uncharacterized protein ISCGN_009311 [Ixodes scapularis]